MTLDVLVEAVELLPAPEPIDFDEARAASDTGLEKKAYEAMTQHAMQCKATDHCMSM